MVNYIDNCLTIPPPNSATFPPIINFTIGTGPLSVNAIVNSSNPLCLANTTFVDSNQIQVPHSILFSFRDDWVDINVTDFSLAGVYNFTQVRTTEGTASQSHSNFILNILDPCISPPIILPNISSFSIGLMNVSVLSITFTSSAPLGICGPFNYSIIDLPNYCSLNSLIG